MDIKLSSFIFYMHVIYFDHGESQMPQILSAALGGLIRICCIIAVAHPQLGIQLRWSYTVHY
jgi:hypothetical protein